MDCRARQHCCSISGDKGMTNNFYYKAIIPYIHHRVPEIAIDTPCGFVTIINQHVEGVAESFVVLKIKFNGMNQFDDLVGQCFAADQYPVKIVFQIGKRFITKEPRSLTSSYPRKTSNCGS
jgi:hypothetical protein